MIIIDLDQLTEDVQSITETIVKAGQEAERITGSAIHSEMYIQDELQKANERYTETINDTLAAMRSEIADGVKRSTVKPDLDYNERTYYATAVKQEIEGLTTKELLARYSDVLAEENEPQKKEFERLALAAMKNAGDDPEVLQLQRMIYENMTQKEQDEKDTKLVDDMLLKSVDVIDVQAAALLQNSLYDLKYKEINLLTGIWEQAVSNAKYHLRQTVMTA